MMMESLGRVGRSTAVARSSRRPALICMGLPSTFASRRLARPGKGTGTRSRSSFDPVSGERISRPHASERRPAARASRSRVAGEKTCCGRRAPSDGRLSMSPALTARTSVPPGRRQVAIRRSSTTGSATLSITPFTNAASKERGGADSSGSNPEDRSTLTTCSLGSAANRTPPLITSSSCPAGKAARMLASVAASRS